MEDNEDLIRVKELLPNLFQVVNYEKLKSMLENVKEIDILYRAGDWSEILDLVKILHKDIKTLQTQL